MAFSFSQQQKASQVQTQRLSQAQIQSLRLLSLNAEDLCDEIYAQAEKNPALEVVPFDSVHTGQVTASGEEKAEAFQKVLESRPDERETLFSYLDNQLNLLKISPEEKTFCQKIIGNLDDRGFYILAPVTLVNITAGESPELLDRCIEIVRGLEPAGICVSNVQESLLLQARIKGGGKEPVFFLLDGHMDFMSPPQPEKILKKISDYVKEQKKLAFNKKDFSELENLDLEVVSNALDFIRTLDPYPARNFSSSDTHYVTPDIYVEKVFEPVEELDFQKREVPADDACSFKVVISDKVIPAVRVSDEFAASQKTSDFAKKAVREAGVFLESLEYRENTIAKAACVIVARQLDFFKKGPGHLSPLIQKDIADAIGVHETTISRMASSKYLECQWGLFPVKYFFTNAVDADATQENIKVQIKKIIEENKDAKKLSDQKISDLLAAGGIKVARRTVAKYRASLNIDSSFAR